MDNVRYWIAVLVVTMIPPAVCWWYVVHPFTRFWRKVGPGGTLAILGVTATSAVALLVTIRDRLVGTDLGDHTGFLIAGLVLIGFAIVIAIQRKKHLTARILSGIPELEAGGKGGTLLDQGIYARVRHPRYVEVALGTLGYAALANFTGAYVVALATIPALHLIVLLEERELRERFGDAYSEYSARTPRYIPRRKG